MSNASGKTNHKDKILCDFKQQHKANQSDGIGPIGLEKDQFCDLSLLVGSKYTESHLMVGPLAFLVPVLHHSQPCTLQLTPPLPKINHIFEIIWPPGPIQWPGTKLQVDLAVRTN